MKKAIRMISVVIVAVLAVGFLALRSYVAHEERKRAAAPGNAAPYDAANLKKHESTVLTGKTIVFLGSSVTYGAAAEGRSFVELFEALDGVNVIKEAKSGTTLADKISVLALLDIYRLPDTDGSAPMMINIHGGRLFASYKEGLLCGALPHPGGRAAGGIRGV